MEGTKNNGYVTTPKNPGSNRVKGNPIFGLIQFFVFHDMSTNSFLLLKFISEVGGFPAQLKVWNDMVESRLLTLLMFAFCGRAF